MSLSPPTPFAFPVRIYWEDTDAGGVVYHARYVGFLERARSEWMRGFGWGQRSMGQELGVIFAVRAMQVDFRKPARLDDALQVTVELVQLGRASLRFVQRIHRDTELLLEAEVKIAALGAEDFRPRPIPDDVHARLQAHLPATD